MSKNFLLILYVFVVLAIVSKGEVGLGRGLVPPIAYAQLWSFSPSIQNQNVNSFHINNNSSTSLQVNRNIATVGTCMMGSSAIHNTSGSTLVGSIMMSSATTAKCGTHHDNNCAKGLHIRPKDNAMQHITWPTIARYGNVIKSISQPLPNLTQIICGTEHDDYIIGSDGDDIIFGLRGNDVIMALGGNDLVFAGPGDDTVYGGDGNNQLFGDDGNDNLVGGSDDDLLVGGPGNDRLYGNTGDDILQGGPGADYFDCGDGLDTVIDYNPSQGDVVSSNCENVNQIH
jgi:RTX calcium-binding nonapeptide repeat (4 copies)